MLINTAWLYKEKGKSKQIRFLHFLLLYSLRFSFLLLTWLSFTTIALKTMPGGKKVFWFPPPLYNGSNLPWKRSSTGMRLATLSYDTWIRSQLTENLHQAPKFNLSLWRNKGERRAKKEALSLLPNIYLTYEKLMLLYCSTTF